MPGRPQLSVSVSEEVTTMLISSIIFMVSNNDVCAIAGITGVPNQDGTVPSIEVVTFRDCHEKDAKSAPDFTVVPIETIQPPKPEAAAAPATRRQLKEGDIGEKQCGIYTKGAGKALLCIESIAHWGADIVQVNGFLENSGRTNLCDVKIGFDDAEKLYSVWPEWARSSTWVNDFMPRQATAIGLTGPAEADGSFPHIVIQDFNICGGGKLDVPPTVQIVSLDEVKDTLSPEASVISNSGKAITDVLGLKNAPQAPAGTPVSPGECTTYKDGDASLRLCLEEPQQWYDDVVHVAGYLENVGLVPICNLTMKSNYEKQKVYSVWPDWVATGSWKAFFPAGQKINVGFTSSPREDGAKPAMTVTAFESCTAKGDILGPSTAQVEIAADGNLPNKLLELGHNMIMHANKMAGEDEKTDEPEPIDWESCTYQKGADGESTLALCWRDWQSWNHKIYGRVVQTNLVLVRRKDDVIVSRARRVVIIFDSCP